MYSDIITIRSNSILVITLCKCHEHLSNPLYTTATGRLALICDCLFTIIIFDHSRVYPLPFKETAQFATLDSSNDSDLGAVVSSFCGTTHLYYSQWSTLGLNDTTVHSLSVLAMTVHQRSDLVVYYWHFCYLLRSLAEKKVLKLTVNLARLYLLYHGVMRWV